jgi:hypothetical protein
VADTILSQRSSGQIQPSILIAASRRNRRPGRRARDRGGRAVRREAGEPRGTRTRNLRIKRASPDRNDRFERRKCASPRASGVHTARRIARIRRHHPAKFRPRQMPQSPTPSAASNSSIRAAGRKYCRPPGFLHRPRLPGPPPTLCRARQLSRFDLIDLSDRADLAVERRRPEYVVARTRRRTTGGGWRRVSKICGRHDSARAERPIVRRIDRRRGSLGPASRLGKQPTAVSALPARPDGAAAHPRSCRGQRR